VLLAILRLPERARWAIAAASVALLATALFGYVAWCAVAADDPLRPLQGVTFSARTDIWSFLLDEIAKRPVLGAGYESLWGINPAVQPSLKTDQWFGTYVIITEGHDGYLDLLATGGVVGLAGGLAVLLRTIRLAAKAVTHAPAASAAWRAGALARPTAIFYLALLLGLAVHNFTESNFFSNNGPLAVAFLLAMLDLEKWRIAASGAKGG